MSLKIDLFTFGNSFCKYRIQWGHRRIFLVFYAMLLGLTYIRIVLEFVVRTSMRAYFFPSSLLADKWCMFWQHK